MIHVASLLQRRIFKEHLHLFALAFVALLTLILLGRALQLRELLLGLELGFFDTLLLFFYMTPFFMLLVVPMACMLGVFLTFLRMSTDRELIALKTGGISIYQLLAPPLLFCCLCFGLTLFISLHGLSWGMAHFRASVMEIASTRARIVVQPGIFNKGLPGLVFFAKKVDPASGALQNVLVEDRSRPQDALTIIAPKGSIDKDDTRGELLFRLHNGRIYSMQGSAVSVLGFSEYTVRLPLDSLFNGLELGPVRYKEMSWSALHAFTPEQLQELSPRLANKLTVEKYKRWVFPVACLVLGMFALPLAAAFEGMNRQYGVMLALGMFLVYYSLLSFGISIAESGALAPAPSLWLPNILFLFLAAYGIRLAAREETPHFSGFFHFFTRIRMALFRTTA